MISDQSRHFDIAVVGAGLAGSTAAAMLARAGRSVAIVDPYRVYPADFRCEKLSADQLGQFAALGLAGAVQNHSTAVNEVVIARGGRPIDARGVIERGLRYDTLVNAMRAEWPSNVAFLEGRVDGITAHTEHPSIRLTSGQSLSARLIVLATGPGEKLRAALGLHRRVIRDNHSICIGFDLVSAQGLRLSERAMTYYGERAGDGVAFATFFPIGDTTRCNFFCYRDPKSPLIRNFRNVPSAALLAAMPGLAPVLGDVTVRGSPEIRITDLYEIDAPQRDGVVLIGDAMHATCPVTGTGVSRVLTDVERLCSAHVPAWLAAESIGAARVAEFYADPIKLAVDRAAAVKTERDRSMSLSTDWRTQTHRHLALAKAVFNRSISRKSAEMLAFRTLDATRRSVSTRAPALARS